MAVGSVPAVDLEIIPAVAAAWFLDLVAWFLEVDLPFVAVIFLGGATILKNRKSYLPWRPEKFWRCTYLPLWSWFLEVYLSA